MNKWDIYAPFYDFTRKFERKAYEKMYANIRKTIKNKNVLELATGTGIIARNVADSAKHITATDFSEKMIEQAEKNIKIGNIDFSVEDACNLPYNNNTYDVVIIANALHIMPNPEKALAEIKRVLKPDGVLIAPTYVWGAMSLRQRLSAIFLRLFGFKVEHSWEKGSYIKYLSDNGWKCTASEVLNACYPLCYAECEKSE